jgi:hypothetical protein
MEEPRESKGEKGKRGKREDGKTGPPAFPSSQTKLPVTFPPQAVT